MKTAAFYSGGVPVALASGDLNSGLQRSLCLRLFSPSPTQCFTAMCCSILFLEKYDGHVAQLCVPMVHALDRKSNSVDNRVCPSGSTIRSSRKRSNSFSHKMDVHVSCRSVQASALRRNLCPTITRTKLRPPSSKRPAGWLKRKNTIYCCSRCGEPGYNCSTCKSPLLR